MANKRKCLACGKEYNFCPRCEASRNTPWMVTFDCAECKEIFNVVSGYNMGLVTLEDVKTVLDKNNISDVSVYQGTIREVLMKAITPEKKVVKEPEKIENVDIELGNKPEQQKVVRFPKGISKK